VEDALQNPLQDVLIMYNHHSNEIYWPAGGIFTLSTFKPGEGYQANFINPVTVTFPAYDMDPDNTKASEPVYNETGPWQVVKTGEVHVISVRRDALDELQGIDYIGAFNSEGNCIGYAYFGITSGGNLPMIVYGDDIYSVAKDGATEGELINFVAYNSATGEQTPLIAEFDTNLPEHNGTFATNGLSIITGLYKDATDVADQDIDASINIFPNPASDLLNIQIQGMKDIISISMHAANGKWIKDLPAVQDNIQTDVSHLSKGIYFVKIEFAGSSVVRRIVIL